MVVESGFEWEVVVSARLGCFYPTRRSRGRAETKVVQVRFEDLILPLATRRAVVSVRNWLSAVA